MSWAELEWPDVPDLPVPEPDQPPPALAAGAKAAVLAVAAKARQRRQLQGWMLFCAIWLGILAVGSQVAIVLPPPHPDAADWQGVLFLACGFTVALVALAGLLLSERPTSAERKLAGTYIAWQIEYAAWLAMARQAYQEALTVEEQARLIAALTEPTLAPPTQA
jgi:hypothetical protein